jgi:hypothetical protein
MEISLQQARMVERDVEARVGEMLNATRTKLAGRQVTTLDSMNDLLRVSANLGDEVEALRALIGVRYNIRQRIGNANNESHLNATMTQMARIDAELHVIEALTYGRRCLDAAKTAAITRLLETQTETPIATTVDTLLTEQALSDLDSLKMELTRERRKLAGVASHINIHQTITLTDAELALLSSVKISP